MKLHWQISIALAFAVVVGSLTTSINTISGFDLIPIFEFFGALFLNALKMIIVPLIVSSIIVGIASIEQDGSFARMGSKTLLYYVLTSTIAIIIGLVMVMVFQPGLINDVPAKEVLGLHADTAEITQKVGDASTGDIAGIFLRMIPPNIIHAAAQGQMLGLIFFSLLFGYFISQLKNEHNITMKVFFEGMFEVMMKMTDLIMRFAPIGVFALVAKIVATSGIDVFIPLAKFFFVVLAALVIHMFVVMPILLKLIARVRPIKHFQAMSPALLTAFSTSSSSATLPVTLDCVQDRAGVSNKTSSFVLPLGATINMDGTALYECVAALFIAQAYGLELGFVQQFTVVILALMTSIGVAGVPAASLVAITIILAAMGLPLEGIGLILAVDRVLDMCRTAVNVFSDSCGAVIIARSEGEQTSLVT
ncbi:MAG: dicarboxylate/amino acid:cation symporter [Gammaproteobacteria bacterium]|nr:dicarboxylate/amino acid:cation symporter [Gammaproteobacteria bacterium]